MSSLQLLWMVAFASAFYSIAGELDSAYIEVDAADVCDLLKVGLNQGTVGRAGETDYWQVFIGTVKTWGLLLLELIEFVSLAVRRHSRAPIPQP